MKRKVISLVIAAVVVGAAWWGWRSFRAKATGAAQHLTVPVRRDTIELTVTGTGAAAAARSEEIRAEVSGTVQAVPVKKGDLVREGDLLILLANDSLELQARQAAVDLESANLSLEELLYPDETDLEAARLKVKQAELALAQREEDLANLLVTSPTAGAVAEVNVAPGDDVNPGALVARVLDHTEVCAVIMVDQRHIPTIRVGQTAEVAAEIALDDLIAGRVTNIASEGVKSSNNTVEFAVSVALRNPGYLRPGMTASAWFESPGVDGSGTIEAGTTYALTARVSGTVAKVYVEAGQEVRKGAPLVELKNRDLALKVEQARNDLAVARHDLRKLQPTPDSTEVKARQLQVDQARTNLESLLADLEKLRVRAPHGGTVASLDASPGNQVAAGALLAVVADYSRMDIVVPIDELEIAKLSPGQKAQVQFDALPGKVYEGELTDIALEGAVKEGVTSYAVTIRVDNTDRHIRGGMTATATVVVDRREGVLVVPAEAVEIRGRRGAVQVLVDGELQPRQVEIGLVGPRFVEITKGLAEGEQVVIAGTSPTSDRRSPMPGFMMPGGGMREIRRP